MDKRVLISILVLLIVLTAAALIQTNSFANEPQNTITVNTLLDLDTDSNSKCSLPRGDHQRQQRRCQWFAGLLHGQLWRGCDQHPNTGSHHTQQRSAFRIE